MHFSTPTPPPPPHNTQNKKIKKKRTRKLKLVYQLIYALQFAYNKSYLWVKMPLSLFI